jgi:hypothetical protein
MKLLDLQLRSKKQWEEDEVKNYIITVCCRSWNKEK